MRRIKDYVLKEHGLKVSNLYISQVKEKMWVRGWRNYNLAKSEDARNNQIVRGERKGNCGCTEAFWDD